ncbi:unnamed protein product [Lactuca saligna]|uniref:Ataxin-2 C-terminal domain-containing protein n=1 Tax=Lactuca saligna TaxID=75948 RepID=A0AA35ZTN1_LACSI|nr:unnamed protein product [Lactuca saligna]
MEPLFNIQVGHTVNYETRLPVVDCSTLTIGSVSSGSNLRLGCTRTSGCICYKYHQASIRLLRNCLDRRVLLSDIFAPNLKGNFLYIREIVVDAPLFVPAAVRQVEDFSPEWWQLVTTSTWFHDYWLSQQQGEDGFFGNTYTPDAYDSSDIADMLPDSIDTDEDILSMEAQYEQFLLSFEMETANAFSPNAYKQMPITSLEAEAKYPRKGSEVA